MTGQGHDHVGGLQRGQRPGEVGGGADDAPAQAPGLEQVVDDPAATVVGDQQMGQAQVVLQRQRGAQAQAVPVVEAGVAGGEQLLPVEALAQAGQRPDGQVHGAFREQGLGGVAVGLAHQHGHRQLLGLQALQDPRQQVRLDVVGHGQHERPVAPRRVEDGLFEQHRRQLLQGPPDARGDLPGLRGGRHAVAGAGEQLVAEEPAQPGQRRAGRGLADAQDGGGPGDVAFAHEHLEGHQQIEVHPPEITFVDVHHCPY